MGIERYPVPGGWMVKVRKNRKLILEFFRDRDWAHTMRPLLHAAFAALCLRNAICGPMPVETAPRRKPCGGMIGHYRAPAFHIRPASAPHNGRAAWDHFTRAAGRAPDRIVWDQPGKQWLAYFQKEAPMALRRGEKPRRLSRRTGVASQ